MNYGKSGVQINTHQGNTLLIAATSVSVAWIALVKVFGLLGWYGTFMTIYFQVLAVPIFLSFLTGVYFVLRAWSVGEKRTKELLMATLLAIVSPALGLWYIIW